MDKGFKNEKRWKEKGEPEFKNEFVENSLKKGETLRKQPLTEVHENHESENEPNGMNPETILEKGYSFQESPDEYRSQRMNRFGKEPNGINPEDR